MIKIAIFSDIYKELPESSKGVTTVIFNHIDFDITRAEIKACLDYSSMEPSIRLFQDNLIAAIRDEILKQIRYRDYKGT